MKVKTETYLGMAISYSTSNMTDCLIIEERSSGAIKPLLTMTAQQILDMRKENRRMKRELKSKGTSQ
jgi:hypothetical protein